MLKKALTIFYIIFSLAFFVYISLPDFSFPSPPPGSLQSNEPADTEIPLRRAYFTDMTRAEVLSWYESQMKRSSFMGIPLPTYLLNYPPEDAQTLIRDQTRSTFLEEIVHPMRESIYVNGYEPPASDEKNAINIEGKHWRQKIIIKMSPSSLIVRLLTTAAIIVLIVWLYNSWTKTIKDLYRGKVRFF